MNAAVTKMKTSPAPADLDARLAELAEREAALAAREAALVEREKSIPPARFTIRAIHRAVIADPTITEAALVEMATKAGAEFKPITIKTQRAMALSFIKMLGEAGYKREVAGPPPA